MGLSFEGAAFDVGVGQYAWNRNPLDTAPTYGKDAYDADLVRLQLPKNKIGDSTGELKIVRESNMILLVTWSPPHSHRGIPLNEFLRFLDNVVSHPKVWNCSAFDEFGQRVRVDKHPGSTRRNMYDACEHMIMKEVAPKDASYAE